MADGKTASILENLVLTSSRIWSNQHAMTVTVANASASAIEKVEAAVVRQLEDGDDWDEWEEE